MDGCKSPISLTPADTQFPQRELENFVLKQHNVLRLQITGTTKQPFHHTFAHRRAKTVFTLIRTTKAYIRLRELSQKDLASILLSVLEAQTAYRAHGTQTQLVHVCPSMQQLRLCSKDQKFA